VDRYERCERVECACERAYTLNKGILWVETVQFAKDICNAVNFPFETGGERGCCDLKLVDEPSERTISFVEAYILFLPADGSRSCEVSALSACWSSILRYYSTLAVE
jgi:hypothetical protein